MHIVEIDSFYNLGIQHPAKSAVVEKISGRLMDMEYFHGSTAVAMLASLQSANIAQSKLILGNGEAHASTLSQHRRERGRLGVVEALLAMLNSARLTES